MKQGDDIWMQFISDVEDATDLCRLDTKHLTREDGIRVGWRHWPACAIDCLLKTKMLFQKRFHSRS